MRCLAEISSACALAPELVARCGLPTGLRQFRALGCVLILESTILGFLCPVEHRVPDIASRKAHFDECAFLGNSVFVDGDAEGLDARDVIIDQVFVVDFPLVCSPLLSILRVYGVLGGAISSNFCPGLILLVS